MTTEEEIKRIQKDAEDVLKVGINVVFNKDRLQQQIEKILFDEVEDLVYDSQISRMAARIMLEIEKGGGNR